MKGHKRSLQGGGGRNIRTFGGCPTKVLVTFTVYCLKQNVDYWGMTGKHCRALMDALLL